MLLQLFGFVASTLAVNLQKRQQTKLQAATFDPVLAQKLYFYTKITVCDKEQIENWDCGFFCNSHPRMTQVKVFENETHSSLAYAGFDKESNGIVVAFRSTQNLDNLLSDIDFFKTDYPCDGCQVHRGFYAAYMDLKDHVIEYMKTLYNEHKKTQVTVLGHSLGAAMATFAAIDLENEGIHINTFYIYGSPRVGNHAFGEYFQTKVKTNNKARITHSQDIVPHLPPKTLDYQHIAKEYWFDTEDHYIECDTSFEDPNCSNSVWNTSINDHQSYFGIRYKCGDEKYEQLTQSTIVV